MLLPSAWAPEAMSMGKHSMKHTDNIAVRRVALLSASLSSFISAFLVSSLNVALPSIARAFSMSAVLLGWVTTSYLLAAAVFLVPFGKVADVVGRKRVFIYGVLLFTLSSVLAVASPSGLFLVGSRIPQGIGAAMIISTIVAILTAVFPAEERGKALGTSVSATYLGLSLGPFLGGILTQQLGWRSIFLSSIPLGLTVVALAAWKLEGEWAGARGEGFDVVGSIIYALSLGAAMYGLSLLSRPFGMWLISGGIAGTGLFIWWETQVERPILNLRLFRHNRLFALSNLTALLNYAGTFAVSFLLSLYLQYVKAFNPQQAGLILVARPVVMAAFSPLAGRLSDRIEPRGLVSVGMGLIIACLALLMFLDVNTSLGFVIGSLLLYGLGFALFSSPNSNAIMSAVERRDYGVASALIGTMRLIGQTLSMGIATLVFAFYIGKVEIIPERYPLFLTSVRTAFIIFTVFCLGGVFASLARGKVR